MSKAKGPKESKQPKQPGQPRTVKVDLADLDRIVDGEHHDPHSILGPHPGKDGVTVRVLRPMAEAVVVVLDDGSRVPLRH